MKLVTGLGNPGKIHQNNRHNVGFIVLDAFAESRGLIWSTNNKLLCDMTSDIPGGFVLCKSSKLFMNKSGEMMSKVLHYYNVLVKDLIVVHDDADLEPMQIKMVKNSSSAGHLGVQNIIDVLGSKDFVRIRIGIGRPEETGKELEKYVLENLSDLELENTRKFGTEHLLSSLSI